MRHGFTIAEFVISITIMLIIVAGTVPMVFKKQKVTTHVARKSGELICSCSDASNACVFELEETGRNEFISVQMIGGGAAGGVIQGGGAGETKIVTYPTLAGTYMAVLGAGGDPNGAKNGGSTLFLKKNDDGTWKLVEFARGGHYSSHANYDESIIGKDESGNYILTAQEMADLKSELNKGKKANFNNAISFLCGSGGDGAYNGATPQRGLSGEVIIKW